MQELTLISNSDAMNNEKVEIKICLGSSCFSRGNKHLVQQIKTFIKDHQLEDEVRFSGSHCFGKCEKGAVIQIDGIVYEMIQADEILHVLESKLLKH